MLAIGDWQVARCQRQCAHGDRHPRQRAHLLKKAQKSDRTRVLDAIQQVADAHPRRLFVATEMVGNMGVWRLRKGDWRMIDEISNDVLTVRAIAVRKDAYE